MERSGIDLVVSTDTSTISMEELMKNVPCDMGMMCQSRMEEKASYIFTHKNADPGCTRMMCEPCVLSFQEWLAKTIVQCGPRSFKCHACDAGPLHYTDYLITPMK